MCKKVIDKNQVNSPRDSSRLYRVRLVAVIVGILMLLWSQAATKPVYAFDNDEQVWSTPIELSLGTKGENVFPKIISDAQGGLHVFWQENVEIDDRVISGINYVYWDGTSWSQPIDVFVGRESWENAWGADAAVDSDGILHTVWLDGSIKYAQRSVNSPVSASSWSHPIELNLVSGGAIGPVTIAVDGDSVHVLYLHSGIDDPGIYYLHSPDRGITWEPPFQISQPGWREWPLNQEEYYLDLLVISDTVHAVWEQPLGEAVRYAKGVAGGSEWLWPVEILGAQRWPNLVNLGEDRLGIFAISALDDQICLKTENLSLDLGETWSEVRQIAQPAKGCLVRVHVLPDSTGRFHMVMSGRTQFVDEPERIWYTEGDGERWLPSKLVTWPNMSYETLGRQPDFPSATISDGNILNLVFHTFAGKIWYTSRPLNAPTVARTQYPSMALPTVADLPDVAPAISAVASPTPLVHHILPSSELYTQEPAPEQQNGRSYPLLMGTFLSLSVLVVAFGFKRFQIWMRQ